MDRHQEKSVAEKLRNKVIAASITTGVGIAALTGCAPNAEAKPSPTETSVVTETPTVKETVEPTATPTETKNESEPSGIIVNYDAFTNWDEKKPSTVPIYTYDDVNSKEYACEQLYVANGIAPIERKEATAITFTGEQITAYIEPRLDLAVKLYRDTSNPQNKEIALNLVECITSNRLPTDDTHTNNARYILEQTLWAFSDAKESELPSSALVTGDIEHITRQSDGTWLNVSGNFDEYAVEYKSSDILGKEAYPIVRYEWADSNDWKVLGIYNSFSNDSDVITWGPHPPQVLDESRANAPYDLSR